MSDDALPPPALLFILSLLAGCSALGLWISYQNSERGVFGGRFLSDLSAGMLLSVAWLHLLDDASEKLEGLTEYPAANASMLFGYLLMATWATVAPCHHTTSNHMPLLSSKTEEPMSKNTFHAMEASISLHSVLIGVSYGLAQTGWQPQLELGLALCVHQLLEGVAIGALGRRVGPHRLHQSEWARTFAIFSFSLPLGAFLAIGVQAAVAFDDQAPSFRWASGLLGAFAGGTLTHIGVEMLHGTDAERAGASFMESAVQDVCPPVSPKVAPTDGAVEFGHEHSHHMHEAAPPPGRKPTFAPHILHSPDCAHQHDPLGRSHTFHILRTLLPRLLATSLGAALMAVLAIWA